MTAPAVTTPGLLFEQVWKKFHRGETHDSLRDLIPATLRRLTGRVQPNVDLLEGDFWAIRDLSFQVGPGQTLGIVGPNGSGKSTTLKLLTRIYQPTRGECSLRGRVGTLIEVSAGFHGDLTGRENVFLQGAIMGMSIKDIHRKFDEIVDFSGISEFIDTPVKRYSSGMNARLGFAIAAHLEPDVLIIDEVLAVGDLSFQERAYGRIRDLARSGIPVIMVSHQLERVADLCTHAIFLRKGEAMAMGSPGEVISAYVSQNQTQRAAVDNTGPIAFESVQLLGGDVVESGERLSLQIDGRVRGSFSDDIEPMLIRVRSLRTGTLLYASGSKKLLGSQLGTEGFSVRLDLQANLPMGNYLVEVGTYDQLMQKDVSFAPAIMFRVSDPNSFRGSVQLNANMQAAT